MLQQQRTSSLLRDALLLPRGSDNGQLRKQILRPPSASMGSEVTTASPLILPPPLLPPPPKSISASSHPFLNNNTTTVIAASNLTPKKNLTTASTAASTRQVIVMVTPAFSAPSTSLPTSIALPQIPVPLSQLTNDPLTRSSMTPPSSSTASSLGTKYVIIALISENLIFSLMQTSVMKNICINVHIISIQILLFGNHLVKRMLEKLSSAQFLKLSALFSHLFRKQKSAGNFKTLQKPCTLELF